MRAFRIRAWGCAFAVIAGLVPALRAADAPVGAGAGAGAAGAKPVVVGYAAVRSLSDVAALANDIGVPLPSQATPQGIGGQFPFIGPDGLAADRPIGLVFSGGPNLNPQNAAAFVLPVKPGVATLNGFVQQGAKPMEQHPDTVLLANPQGGSVAFRRTEGNLIFGSHPDAVAGLDDTIVAEATKGQGVLARAAVDIRAIRQSMPEQFKAFLDQIERNVAAGDPNNAAAAMGVQFVTALLREKLDRFELGVDRGERGLRVLSSVAPLDVPQPAALPRPGLPQGCVVRIDLALPPAKLFPLLNEHFIQATIEAGQRNGARKLTPEQQKQVQAFITRLTSLILGGDAATVGVTAAGGAPVVYVVKQYANQAAAPDFTGELQKLVAEARRMIAADPTDKTEMKLTSYSADGMEVTRLAPGKGDGKAEGYLDVVQRGPAVYMTISTREFNAVTALAKLAPEAPMQSVVVGWVDVGAAFDAVARIPGNDVAGMPEAQRKQVADILRGQRISWSAAAAGGGVTFDVTVPMELLKGVPKLVGMEQNAAGK